ncbi:MAG: DNA internalization-related competence protein ComEC/Rec2 [Marinicellaceae bacterium]
MLIFSISFLIGVSQLIWLPYIDLMWLTVALPAFILCFLLKNKCLKCTVILLGLCLGFIFAISNAYFAKNNQFLDSEENEIKVNGIIDSLPVSSDLGARGHKTQFALRVMDSTPKSKIDKILVNWYNNENEVEIGQKWVLNLKLKPINGYHNPGSFDYSKWLFRQGFDATASVKNAQYIHSIDKDWSYWIDKRRFQISQLIENNFTSSRVKGLIQALSIGDKSKINFQDAVLFQETGTAHIIAISGLHIGLIAFIGILFGRMIFYIFPSEKFNRLKIEAIFAISFALFYALLAGLSIPTVRALVMVLVFSIAHSSKFNISRWQAWSFALMVVLITDPFSVLDMGFWFSFIAVALLMLAFTGRKAFKSKVGTFIQAQLIILIGLMPIMVIVFQKVNLLTPISNLILLPLASLVLIPLMFLTLIVSYFSINLASYLFKFLEDIAGIFFMVLDYLQEFNFLFIQINSFSLFSIITLILLMTFLLLPKLFRWKILAIFFLVPFVRTETSQLEKGEFLVNVLDVGQGLSVVLQTQDYAMVYDVGAKFESGFSLANSVVVPFLNHQGIHHIDKLILSHNDNDHAGGVDAFINAFPLTEIYDVMGKHKACQYPNSWTWNEVVFEVLSPFEIKPYLKNNSSCVLKISSSSGSILLTGDIEEPVEYRLITQFKQSIESDVILVPHHGSKTSSSQNFINTINPKIALNSSGYLNQFNHPHPIVKSRYTKNNISFYDTQEKGMIELLFSQNSIVINQFLDNNRHFWHVK